MKTLPTPSESFILKKEKILAQLSVPDEEYTDASPKGSVDTGIRELIGQINAHPGLVTTSSCAGRVSVYLEGSKAAAGAKERPSSADGGEDEGAEGNGGRQASLAGGKGGGEWLFVSHDPVERVVGQEGYEALFGLRSTSAVGEAVQGVDLTGSSRLIHFKFEPMVSLSLSPFAASYRS